MASRTFNFIEICAGGGMCGIGASAALQYLGRAARCVCHIERNGYAAATLVGRMEDASLDQAPVWDHLESFDCKPWRGLVDLAIATIPCQGNSVAGKRLLEDDERNLWPATRATLRDLECEYFFLENVPGMLVPDREGGRTAPILRIVGELAEDGWDAEWDVVSAEEVGANHRRERVFLLAHRRRKCDQRRGITGKLGIEATAEYPEAHQRKRDGDAVGNRGDEVSGQSMADGKCAGWTSRERSIGIRVAYRRTESPLGGAIISESGTVGNTFDARLGGRNLSGRGYSGEWIGISPGMDLPVFAPARNDYFGWIRVLNADPTLVPAIRRPERRGIQGDSEAGKPAFRGILDGLAKELGINAANGNTRADELRLCGNGVVYQAAAEAFVRLWTRLHEVKR